MTQHQAAPRVAVIGIIISLILAVGVAVLRSVNADPVERAAEVAGTIAFATVFATPALLAMLGVRGRPSLLFAAGALDLVLAFVTLFSLIGLVFVVPAVMFFVAAGKPRGSVVSRSRSISAVLVAVALGTAGFFALFAHEDPICWARNAATGQSFRLDPDTFVHGSTISMDSRDLPRGATESGCTSDSISVIEATAGIVIVATMLAGAWVLSTPTAEELTPAPTGN
ncbi:MAG: hypothetical protein ACXWEJ_01055 [Actinomycetota bacterium]